MAISIARSIIAGYAGDGIPADMITDVKQALELPKSKALKRMLNNPSEVQAFINKNKASDMDMRLIAATPLSSTQSVVGR